MEQKFKKILEKSKALESDPLSRTFEGDLFKNSPWFFHFMDSPPESFKRESHPKPIEELNLVASENFILQDELKSQSTTYLDPLCLVVFLGDTFKGEGEDLLGKMIAAMQLKEGEYYRLAFDTHLEQIEDLSKNLTQPSAETKSMMDFLSEKRPRIVVTLGATVTNILLGKREKLSSIRGQFHQKILGEVAFDFIPVFHPEFLIINPNMKRTAWIDLQKVMSRVGKN